MPRLTQDQLLALSRAANFEWETITQYTDVTDWIKILKELGFVEVGGRWVKMIPSYASTVKQSVTTAGAVAGTTATIYETVTSPVSKIIASNTGTKVTTSGVLTATSTSVGAAACAGALGFKIGVDWFEAMPEAWTEFSNMVFGTDLDPSEIGQLARDTNALVMIKDGICFMAEDLVTAMRDALFDLGAADSFITIPPVEGAQVDIDVTSLYGAPISSADELKSFFGGADWYSAEIQANAVELFTTYNKYMTGTFVTREGKGYSTYFSAAKSITTEPPFTKTFVQQSYPNTQNGFMYSAQQRDNLMEHADFSFSLNAAGKIVGGKTSSGTGYLNYVYGDITYISNQAANEVRHIISTINAEASSALIGVTPTGQQGTKEQTLDEVFPEWVAKAVTTIGDFPDTVRRWLPLTLPSTLVETQGNPLTTTQAQTGALPEDETEAAAQIQSNTDTKTTTQTGEALSPTPLPLPLPTITPTPDTPPIFGGGGSATGLANLYNPTLAQVKQFSRWLWGSDGLNLDQLKKLLQDPMQAIIGLHVMYATPTTGANRDIQVGYINSGVQSKIVTEQYTEIDCGTVTIKEYFGDARDYSPYTQVYCYLPFIGIVELNADDVVNSTLGIKYKIDVLTGCCLAQLTVKKYGLNAVLYTYTGNCAVQMPITSGNYLSTVSSLLGAVVSGAAAVATGGALAPVAIGAAANAMGGGARASVAMSGSLGSNAGAMGIRKPYLIIKRVESADANGYNEFYGYPTNKRVNLSQLTGYVRVKEINLSGTNATEDEQNEIVSLLKEGVIL